jgi:hypothetical protein
LPRLGGSQASRIVICYPEDKDGGDADDGTYEKNSKVIALAADPTGIAVGATEDKDPVAFVVHIPESPSTKVEQGHIHSLLNIVREIDMIRETGILFIISDHVEFDSLKLVTLS